MKPFFFYFFLFSLLLPADTKDWHDHTAKNLQHDIDAATLLLKKSQQDIAARQTELLQACTEKTRAIEQAQENAHSLSKELTSSQQNASSLSQELADINNAIQETQNLLQASDIPACRSVLTERIKRIATAVRAEPVNCSAETPQGIVCNGKLIQAGPLALFKPDVPTIPPAIAAFHPNQPLPQMFDKLTPEQADAIDKLFNSEKGTLQTVPLDISGGNALSIVENTDSLLSHLKKGGMLMIPLLLLAAFCTVILLCKLIQFSTLPGRNSLKTVTRLSATLAGNSTGLPEDRLQAVNTHLRPLLQCFSTNFELDKDALEEQLYASTLAVNIPLERFLSTLAVCASTAPLLGLLGTVTGMIHTFSLITVYGTGDPRLLSTGISEALITTEVGLTIAIPALLAHAWCTRRLKRFKALQQELSLILLSRRH